MLHSTVRERDAPSNDGSMGVGWSWDANITLVWGASGNWFIDRGWDGDIACWANLDKSDVIAYIIPVSVYIY